MVLTTPALLFLLPSFSLIIFLDLLASAFFALTAGEKESHSQGSKKKGATAKKTVAP